MDRIISIFEIPEAELDEGFKILREICRRYIKCRFFAKYEYSARCTLPRFELAH